MEDSDDESEGMSDAELDEDEDLSDDDDELADDVSDSEDDDEVDLQAIMKKAAETQKRIK